MSARRGVVRCSAAAVLFGVSAPAASRLAGDLGAFTLAGLLYVGAAGAVLPVVGRHRPTRAAVRRALPNLALAVLLGGAVGPVLLAAGLGRLPAATSSLLLNLELVFTTLVAGLVYREHIGRAVVAGTALVLGGGLVLGWSGRPEARWGAVLVAGACLCWAVDNSATASIDQLAPSHLTLVKGVVAGGSNLLIGLATTGSPPARAALGALVVGAVGYGLSITLWVAGARDLGAARGQLVFATAPFIGAVVAWLVLGEAATGREAVAFALGLAGVGSVLFSAHAHDHHHEPARHVHEHDHDDPHHRHDHDGPVPARHTDAHEHPALAHQHPHVPDLHHRHDHGT